MQYDTLEVGSREAVTRLTPLLLRIESWFASRPHSWKKTCTIRNYKYIVKYYVTDENNKNNIVPSKNLCASWHDWFSSLKAQECNQHSTSQQLALNSIFEAEVLEFDTQCNYTTCLITRDEDRGNHLINKSERKTKPLKTWSITSTLRHKII